MSDVQESGPVTPETESGPVTPETLDALKYLLSKPIQSVKDYMAGKTWIRPEEADVLNKFATAGEYAMKPFDFAQQFVTGGILSALRNKTIDLGTIKDAYENTQREEPRLFGAISRQLGIPDTNVTKTVTGTLNLLANPALATGFLGKTSKGIEALKSGEIAGTLEDQAKAGKWAAATIGAGDTAIPITPKFINVPTAKALDALGNVVSGLKKTEAGSELNRAFSLKNDTPGSNDLLNTINERQALANYNANKSTQEFKDALDSVKKSDSWYTFGKNDQYNADVNKKILNYVAIPNTLEKDNPRDLLREARDAYVDSHHDALSEKFGNDSTINYAVEEKIKNTNPTIMSAYDDFNNKVDRKRSLYARLSGMSPEEINAANKFEDTIKSTNLKDRLLLGKDYKDVSGYTPQYLTDKYKRQLDAANVEIENAPKDTRANVLKQNLASEQTRLVRGQTIPQLNKAIPNSYVSDPVDILHRRLLDTEKNLSSKAIFNQASDLATSKAKTSDLLKYYEIAKTPMSKRAIEEVNSPFLKKNTYFDKDISSLLKEKVLDNESKSYFGSKLDNLTHNTKAMMFGNPLFTVRNMNSGLIQANNAGVNPLSAIAGTVKNTVQRLLGKANPYAEELARKNIVSSGRSLVETGNKNGLWNIAKPFHAWGEKVGTPLENDLRSAVYEKLRKKGYSADSAAQKTLADMYGYNNKTKFERSVMDRLFPIGYSWVRNNVPRTLQNLVQHPARTLLPTKLPYAYRETQKPSERAPLEGMSENMAENTPLVRPADKNGMFRQMPQGFATPMGDINLLLGARRDPKQFFSAETPKHIGEFFLKMTNPVVQGLVSHITNKNPISGQRVSRMEGEQHSLLGIPMPSWLRSDIIATGGRPALLAEEMMSPETTNAEKLLRTTTYLKSQNYDPLVGNRINRLDRKAVINLLRSDRRNYMRVLNDDNSSPQDKKDAQYNLDHLQEERQRLIEHPNELGQYKERYGK